MEIQTITRCQENMVFPQEYRAIMSRWDWFQSLRKDDYAYRAYDINAINRLQQILVLRKLRILVKEMNYLQLDLLYPIKEKKYGKP